MESPKTHTGPGQDSDDYDSPWKAALGRYFPAFLALLFPEVHAGIDWTRGYTFLDKELRQVVRDAELGKRRADILVRVHDHTGAEGWLLLHIEVQGQSQAEFAERMYVYHYRIYDRFRRPVVSLAVLADSHATWRPDHFGYGRWGCELSLRFPMVKLIDYQERWAELDGSSNPFAVVVQAQLQAQLQGTASRYQAKLALIKSLYRRGLARADILELFRCIDWMLRLPEDLDEQIWCEIQTYEEAAKMPYVTSVERIGIRKGIQQGLEQGLEQGLQQGRAAERQLLLRQARKRFGDTSAEAVAPLLAQIQDTAVLEDLADLLLDCDNGVEWLAAVQDKVLGA